MALQLWTNNASGTLASTLNPGDTSLTLNSGQGALFPNPSGGDWFVITIEDTLGNIEIVDCDARSGDVLSSLQRGIEGTTAQTFAAGSRVEIRLTAESLDQFLQMTDPIWAKEAQHGEVSGAASLVRLSVRKLLTIAKGIQVYGESSATVSAGQAHDGEIRLVNTAGAETGALRHPSNSNLRLQNNIPGGTVGIAGTRTSDLAVISTVVSNPDAGGVLRWGPTGTDKLGATATGANVAGVITGDTAPTAAEHLTRKDYVDTQLAAGLATKAALSHHHDDRYYTEAEVDTLIATRAAASHTHAGLMTGFESSEIAISQSGSGSAAHGLGGAPHIVHAFYRCKIAEFGYSIGDEIPIQATESLAANSISVGILSTVSHVAYVFKDSANVLSILRLTPTVGAPTNATLANWRLVIRAWRIST